MKSQETQLSDQSQEQLIARATEEFVQQLEAGVTPDLETFVLRYPSVAADLRNVLTALQAIEVAAPEVFALSDGEGGVDRLHELGDFRLIRELGRGGMGVVYAAEQISLGRRVALKILPLAGILDERQLRRFQNEARAAAQLHHPNILPIYSVGCERGVHYYAMQLIEGPTLGQVISHLRVGEAGKEQLATHERTDARRGMAGQTGDSSGTHLDAGEVAAFGGSSGGGAGLPGHAGTAAVSDSLGGSTRSSAFFQAVAQLGIQAAEALQCAHDEGIVHRDIKPSNLLLDTRGKLWIADFGLARIEQEPGITMTGDLLGTLRYMSPEQALGKPAAVDQRTDVYSLGVTLYELMTLTPSISGVHRQEVLRRIAEEETRPPSPLNPAIPRDLETVILKAVAKEPGDRYSTARDLADDLRRFLNHEPIQAKRAGLRERVFKWSRRHSAFTASVAAILLIVTAGSIISTSLLLHERSKTTQERSRTAASETHARSERARAQQNFETARRAIEQMVEAADTRLITLPATNRMRRMLDQAALYYDTFAQENADDPGIQLDVVRAYLRLGEIRRELGPEWNPAGAYGRGAATLQNLLNRSPQKVEYLELLAECDVGLGIASHDAGESKQGDEAFDAAVQLWSKLIEAHPQEPLYREALARLNIRLAWLAGDRGYSEWPPEEGFQAALDLLNGLMDQHPERLEYRKRALEAMLGLGVAHLAGYPDADKAAASLDPALKLAGELQETMAQDAEFRHMLGSIHYAYGMVHARKGRRNELEKSYQQAIDIWSTLVQEHPGVPRYQEDLGNAYRRLGQYHAVRAKPDDPRSFLARAVEIHTQLNSAFPGLPDGRVALALSLAAQADALWQAGLLDEAESLFRQAIDIRGQLAADFPKTFAYTRALAQLFVNLAEMLHDAERTDDAIAALQQAARHWEKLANERPDLMFHPFCLAAAWVNLGTLLREKGDVRSAEGLESSALAMLQGLARKSAPVYEYLDSLAGTFMDPSRAFRELGRYFEADPDIQLSIRIFHDRITEPTHSLENEPDGSRLFEKLPVRMAFWRRRFRASAGPSPEGDTGRIAFTRNQNSIVILDVETREERVVLAPGTFSTMLQRPCWSHTQPRWLVFFALNREDGENGKRTAGLWVVQEDGTGLHQLLAAGQGNIARPYHPALSPDDQWLAFTSSDGEQSGIYIQAFDASAGQARGEPILIRPRGSSVSDLSWSPDGRSIIYLGRNPSPDGGSETRYNSDVFRIDVTFEADASLAAAGEPVNLTPTPAASEYAPTWSAASPTWPEGRILFAGGAADRGLAFIDPRNPDDVRVITTFGVQWPSWSPDGRRIAFVHADGPRIGRDIFSVAQDGTDFRRLLKTDGIQEFNTVWCPPAFIDCNDNGLSDTVDMARGASLDHNSDGVPDECQPSP